MNASVDITNVMPFLLSLAASGIGVILLAQAIKKGFGMESDKAIHVMVVLVSGVATVASYVLQYKNLPMSVLGISGPAIYGFSQGVYKTAKILSDLLPKVTAALHKPAKTTADGAVPAMDVPADVAAEPAAAASAASDTNGFNA